MFALTHTWDSPTDWVTQASFLGDRSLVQQKNEYFHLLTSRKINRLCVTFTIT